MSDRFETLTVGESLPERERLVTREDILAYADASGDQNPLHQDDAIARAAGFSRVIAHGMFTMGHLASTILAWAGDEGALVRMRAAFRAPVLVDETVVAGGSVRGIDLETRTASLEVWVRLQRDGATEWPIKRSEAEVRFA